MNDTGTVKLVKPGDITTFTFNWISESDDMKVVRHVGNGPSTVYPMSKAKARNFWKMLIANGYKAETDLKLT